MNQKINVKLLSFSEIKMEQNISRNGVKAGILEIAHKTHLKSTNIDIKLRIICRSLIKVPVNYSEHAILK